jgi:hypothetical protein
MGGWAFSAESSPRLRLRRTSALSFDALGLMDDPNRFRAGSGPPPEAGSRACRSSRLAASRACASIISLIAGGKPWGRLGPFGVIDPTSKLALIFRSPGDRPCAPLAGWRTIPSRIGRAFRSVGCPSDSGPHGSYRPGSRVHKAGAPDRSCPTIWHGHGGVSTAVETGGNRGNRSPHGATAPCYSDAVPRLVDLGPRKK